MEENNFIAKKEPWAVSRDSIEIFVSFLEEEIYSSWLFILKDKEKQVLIRLLSQLDLKTFNRVLNALEFTRYSTKQNLIDYILANTADVPSENQQDYTPYYARLVSLRIKFINRLEKFLVELINKYNDGGEEHEVLTVDLLLDLPKLRKKIIELELNIGTIQQNAKYEASNIADKVISIFEDYNPKRIPIDEEQVFEDIEYMQEFFRRNDEDEKA